MSLPFLLVLSVNQVPKSSQSETECDDDLPASILGRVAIGFRRSVYTARPVVYLCGRDQRARAQVNHLLKCLRLHLVSPLAGTWLQVFELFLGHGSCSSLTYFYLPFPIHARGLFIEELFLL